MITFQHNNIQETAVTNLPAVFKTSACAFPRACSYDCVLCESVLGRVVGTIHGLSLGAGFSGHPMVQLEEHLCFLSHKYRGQKYSFMGPTSIDLSLVSFSRASGHDLLLPNFSISLNNQKKRELQDETHREIRGTNLQQALELDFTPSLSHSNSFQGHLSSFHQSRSWDRGCLKSFYFNSRARKSSQDVSNPHLESPKWLLICTATTLAKTFWETSPFSRIFVWNLQLTGNTHSKTLP